MKNNSEKGLPVHLKACHFDFHVDTEDDFIQGCYSGLRMILGQDERERGLQEAGLPQETGQPAEASKGGTPMDVGPAETTEPA